MQDGSTVTAVAFTPDGASVAVANAANEVVLFDVATLQHTRWSGQSAARLPARLLNMPGRVMHISFCPDPSVRAHQQHPYFDPRPHYLSRTVHPGTIPANSL